MLLMLTRCYHVTLSAKRHFIRPESLPTANVYTYIITSSESPSRFSNRARVLITDIQVLSAGELRAMSHATKLPRDQDLNVGAGR